LARVTDRELEAAITAVLDRRGRGKSICPSEVARALDDDWRPLMPEVRRVAQGMAAKGQLRVTQNGKRVAAQAARGPIRLSRPMEQDSD
jgi:hypothetical protein